MWSNYKGEFTYYISFVLFPRLVMTHLIKLPTLLEIKFKRYILVVNIWINWCWSSISGLSYNITRNYEVVMVESALVGRWVLILMRVGECDHESTICVSQKFFWKAIQFFHVFIPSSKHFGLVIYTRSNPNHTWLPQVRK